MLKEENILKIQLWLNEAKKIGNGWERSNPYMLILNFKDIGVLEKAIGSKEENLKFVLNNFELLKHGRMPCEITYDIDSKTVSNLNHYMFVCFNDFNDCYDSGDGVYIIESIKKYLLNRNNSPTSYFAITNAKTFPYKQYLTQSNVIEGFSHFLIVELDDIDEFLLLDEVMFLSHNVAALSYKHYNDEVGFDIKPHPDKIKFDLTKSDILKFIHENRGRDEPLGDLCGDLNRDADFKNLKTATEMIKHIKSLPINNGDHLRYPVNQFLMEIQ